MVLFHQIAGAFFLPPLLFIWLIVLGLWFKRRVLVWGGLLLCYALATPRVAFYLSAPLECWPVISAHALKAVDVIVVLGGGARRAPEYGGEDLTQASLVRLRYAAYLARLSGKPLLLSSGAPHGGTAEAVLMERSLKRDFGLYARWVEPQSRTTAENARYTAKILKSAGLTRIALVSQGWHLRRAVPVFTRLGLKVLPAPTEQTYVHGLGLIPNGRAMEQSWAALREWMGIAFYRVRGDL